jgi:two-component system, chemotaxis family, chemotaxis protein CheY
MKILSIDDSKAVRVLIRSAVDVLGFEFDEAADGKQGIEVLEKLNGKVDLILLDWNMPVMDGMEMLRKIKNDERFKKIPVTMVTTEIERHKVIEAISAGAKSYLMKPFTQEQLAGKILESLGMGS